jgi:hypothetical protein
VSDMSPPRRRTPGTTAGRTLTASWMTFQQQNFMHIGKRLPIRGKLKIGYFSMILRKNLHCLQFCRKYNYRGQYFDRKQFLSPPPSL